MDDDDLDAMLDDAADDVLASAPPSSASTRAAAPSPTADILDDAAAAIFQQHQPPTQTGKSHGMLRVPRPATTQPPKPKEPPTLEEAVAAVLPPAQAEKWLGVLQEDAAVLQSYRPRPPSFAYQSFQPSSGVSSLTGGSKPKRGSDATPAAAAAAAAAAEEQGGPGTILSELILRACSKAGVSNTEGLRTELKTNDEMRAKLEGLFVKQMKKDLVPYVEGDERFERERFPGTARTILGLMEEEGEEGM
ncbi:Hypothetical protein NocV09_02001180 [Nannochloropsis oceanica]